MKNRSLIVAVVCAGSAFSLYAADGTSTNAWDSKFVIGANLAKGNSENIGVNAGVSATRKGGANEFDLGVQGNYSESEVVLADGSTDSQTSVQNAKAFATYRRLLDERTFVTPHAELNHDKIADISYRLMAGVAVGHYFIKDNRGSLTAEIGADYIRDDVAGVLDNRAALRIAHRYDLKINAGAKVWETVEYLPTLDDFGQFLLNAEIGVETAMSERLNLRVVLQDKYNSRPSEGKKCNDLLMTTGLSWAF